MQKSATRPISNATLVREYCCATCWGRVVEYFEEGQYVVHCPKKCEPGGFVHQNWVDEQKLQSRHDAIEVRQHYPQLFEATMTREQFKKMRDALNGEEDDN